MAEALYNEGTQRTHTHIVSNVLVHLDVIQRETQKTDERCADGEKMLEKKKLGTDIWNDYCAHCFDSNQRTHTRMNTIVVVASGIVRALRTSFTEKWNPRRRRTHNFFGDLRALILTFLRRAHGA